MVSAAIAAPMLLGIGLVAFQRAALKALGGLLPTVGVGLDLNSAIALTGRRLCA